jgi:hypothetical protein
MTVRVILADSDTGRSAHVSERGAQGVYVVPEPLPNFGEANRKRFFRQYLTVDGLAAGTNNMNIDGSSPSIDYYLPAVGDYDIYIQQIIVVLADTAVSHNNFGNVSPLSNGFDLIVFESGEETPLIDKAKTGGQMLAQSGLLAPFGDGSLVNELSNWTGTTDAQIITFPVSQYVNGGIRLGRGNTDRLIARINDDLTGLTEFTVLALGMRLYS